MIKFKNKMLRSHNLPIVLVFFLFLFLFLFSCKTSKDNGETTKNQKYPNIVLILSDDQSWTDYGFLGHEHIETPRLDQLAEEGLTFTYGYTTAPLCRPALASIATGLYPHQHKVVGNDPVIDHTGKKYTEEWLTKRKKRNDKYVQGIGDLNTIADLLDNVGYTSLQTGKWWEGHFSNGGFNKGMTLGDPSQNGRHGDEGLKIGREGLQIIYDFIDSTQNEETPFFIWYAPFLPHAPHTPPDSLKEKYMKLAPTPAVAYYWAMCEWFDITCGQLVDYVDEKGLSENTLFIYVTDNGWIQDPDRPNRYAPRSKREPYEMGIRTPIIFRWLGGIESRMDTINPVSSIDIATTIFGICGIEKTEQMQGINVLNDEALNNREAIFAETYAHDFTTVDSSLYYRIIIDMPWKLIFPDPINKPDETARLYNIVNDPHETKNLAETNPTKVEELIKKIDIWWRL